MKQFLSFLLLSSLTVAGFAQDEQRTFSNLAGKTLTDRIIKYDFDTQEIIFEKNGKIPLETFSEADQAYILHWNQIAGLKSTMRLKIDAEKDDWATMKHEQSVTPVYMDAIQIPGKKNPTHHVIVAEDYEEYSAVYLQAEGYEIKIRNQNIFPLENLVVESKIFYQQELYVIPDSLFLSSEKDYDETTVTNKSRFISESIPLIIPREEVILNSECAVIIDHQLERNSLISASPNSEETDGSEGTIEGFSDWDDHSRRRKGRVLGVWVRVGMKGPDGNMVWRETTSPSSLDKKVSWEGFLDDLKEDEESSEETPDSTPAEI